MVANTIDVVRQVGSLLAEPSPATAPTPAPAPRGRAGFWALLSSALGKAVYLAPAAVPLAMKWVDHRAEERKMRFQAAQESRARFEDSLQARVNGYAKKSQPIAGDTGQATLCGDDSCHPVTFLHQPGGGLHAKMADGTVLTKCSTAPDGKRACEWKGRKLTEK
ncbi:MAG: hypothetical protein A2Y74_06550 [Actinobacteria bacterium RBG_13_63_9]|nr:MAG: hypothetical protein A2Y74_06550 [Actinobacteria bacterium RBG_13_63_9]